MEAYQYGLAKRKSADKDQIIKHILTAVSGVAVLAIFLIILFIAYNSVDAFKDVGILQFLFGTEWDPAEGIYGAVPVITGTILVTLGAVAFAVPVGVGCAIYISEVAPAKYRNILKPVCEVFAGIPSVVYGFIGLILLVPLILDMFGGQAAPYFVIVAFVSYLVAGHRGVYPAQRIVTPKRRSLADDAGTTVEAAIEHHRDQTTGQERDDA